MRFPTHHGEQGGGLRPSPRRRAPPPAREDSLALRLHRIRRHRHAATLRRCLVYATWLLVVVLVLAAAVIEVLPLWSLR